jgi:DNA invertase Pin-like site-specific DNA recombinase
MENVFIDMGFAYERINKNDYIIEFNGNQIFVIENESKASSENKKCIFYNKKTTFDNQKRKAIFKNMLDTGNYGYNLDDEKRYCNIKIYISRTQTVGDSYYMIPYEAYDFKEKTENLFGNAIGYTRVSTLMQADDGKSLDNQEDKIYEYAARNNLRIKMICTDYGKSGSNLIFKPGMNSEKKMEHALSKRKGLKKAIESGLKDDTVIFHSVSRFIRNMFLFHVIIDCLKEKKTKIVFLDFPYDLNDPMSSMIISFIGLLAEIESKTTSKRTKEVMENMNKAGILKKKLRYGKKYNDQYQIVDDEEEQRILKEIKAIYDFYGNPSYSIVLDEIKKRHIPPLRKSKGWSAQILKRLIQADCYDIKPVGPKKEYVGRKQIGIVEKTTTYKDHQFKPKNKE